MSWDMHGLAYVDVPRRCMAATILKPAGDVACNMRAPGVGDSARFMVERTLTMTQ